MPRPKKPAEERARRNYADVGLVAVPTEPTAIVPDAPKSWLVGTRKAWETFWQSPQAALVQAADRPSLDRLFQMQDDRERLHRQIVKSWLVTGSTGQPVLNPLAKVVEAYDREIRQLEDRFGLSPMSRLRLGVKFVQGKTALDKLNEELAGARDEIEAGETQDDDYDPRIVDAEIVEG